MPSEPESEWRFDALCRDVQELITVVRNFGLVVPANGALAAASWDLQEIADTFAGRSLHDAASDHRPRWRRAVGVADLARKILAVRGHKDFGQLKGHLKLLVGSDEISLYAHTPPSNDTNNKIFELFIGASLMRFMSDCALEEPNPKKAAKTLNPDFLGTWNGKRWGIACKALHSDHPEATLKNIGKGIDQIEKSPAEIGLVLLNTKNLIPHDAVWPAREIGGVWSYSPYPHPANIRDVLLPGFHQHAHTVLARASGEDFSVTDDVPTAALEKGRETVRAMFAGKKACPWMPLIWLAVVGTRVPRTGDKAITNFRFITNFEFSQENSAEATALAEKLNLAMHGRDPNGPEPALGN